MKKIKLINKLSFVLSLSMLAISCSDDGGTSSGPGFAGIVSSYYEGEGDLTKTIPIVNGSVSQSDIIFDGTATQGEDYEVLGVTEDGVEIKFLEDDTWEDQETLRMRISNGSNGANVIHEVTLISDNCEDPEGMTVADLAGTYTVVTDTWEDYAPGSHLTVEAVDETHVRIVNYPHTTVSHAPLVLTIADLSTGAITVASQNNGSYNASGTQQTTTSGTGEVTTPCTLDLTLTFVLPCCGTNPDYNLVLQRE